MFQLSSRLRFKELATRCGNQHGRDGARKLFVVLHLGSCCSQFCRRPCGLCCAWPGLAHQRKTLLRSLQKPRESGSIFLVPEPSLESSPLLSLKMPNDGRLEVDFIEVSASEDNIRGNSINVLVGLYALGEPTLKLNGVLGCYLKPPYRKQLITPHYWDFGRAQKQRLAAKPELRRLFLPPSAF